jgi:hypothetical protein
MRDTNLHGEIENVYKLYVGKPKGNIPFGRLSMTGRNKVRVC